MTDRHIGLYPISQAILASANVDIVKIDSHDPDDAESADVLWIALEPDSDDEGEAIYVGPSKNGFWNVTYEKVCETDSATGAMFWGSEAEVRRDVLATIRSTSNKGADL